MRLHNRILVSVALIVLFATTAAAQARYTGIMEYSLPLLTSVPPLDSTQPSDVASAYLWADELMRTTKWVSINHWIGNLGYGDTMKFLAKMLYEVSDNNPLSLYQWQISGNPNSVSQHLAWNYLGFPAQEVPMLVNQIGAGMSDTGRTGFILACDLIADVSVSDTILKNDPTDKITPDIVMAQATILDEIKGQKVPYCIGAGMRTRKNNSNQALSYTTVWPTHAVAADTGTCLQFEYSPEWSQGLAGDELPFWPALSDSTGPWVKMGGEYIVFLRIAGIGSDASSGYFSIQPYWGVFGTQGAMYKVIGGIVQDPKDDFGIG
ncbi:MAG TPA: hypothetical protein VGM92_06485, partial [Candidatus Kapabacteria bacterium]